MLSTRDFNETIKRLPEERKNDPRTFYKIVKALSKLDKSSMIVKGFVENGVNIPLDVGLKKIVKRLYCPKKGILSHTVVDEIALSQSEFPISVTEAEVGAAIERISYDKSSGVDE